MHLVLTILKRTVALIILKVSAVLAAGSIGGVELWKSALIAAFVGVMDVAESLARAYVVDGKLDDDEINTAFASSAEAKLSETKQAGAAAVAVAGVAVAAAAPSVISSYDDEDEDEEDDNF